MGWLSSACAACDCGPVVEKPAACTIMLASLIYPLYTSYLDLFGEAYYLQFSNENIFYQTFYPILGLLEGAVILYIYSFIFQMISSFVLLLND